jgi:hypothetical protein
MYRMRESAVAALTVRLAVAVAVVVALKQMS